MLAEWQPLVDPTAFTPMFKLWRGALKMAVPDEKPQDQVQVYGSSVVVTTAPVMYVLSSHLRHSG